MGKSRLNSEQKAELVIVGIGKDGIQQACRLVLSKDNVRIDEAAIPITYGEIARNPDSRSNHNIPQNFPFCIPIKIVT